MKTNVLSFKLYRRALMQLLLCGCEKATSLAMRTQVELSDDRLYLKEKSVFSMHFGLSI